MKPVFQTKFYEPGVVEAKQRGNCWSATIASLLELPIEAVPNFVEIDVLGGPNWWWLTREYLKLMGLELHCSDVDNPPTNRYYLVSGISPRGVYHSCIYRNGKLVHDPHPEGLGLLTEEQAEVLELTETGPYQPTSPKPEDLEI